MQTSLVTILPLANVQRIHDAPGSDPLAFPRETPTRARLLSPTTGQTWVNGALLDYLAGDCRWLAAGEEPSGPAGDQRQGEDREGEGEDRDVAEIAEVGGVERRAREGGGG